MDRPFPLGLPTETAFYLSLYLLTLMVHIAFMNYVLAGSAYLAANSVVRGRAADESPIYDVLRDWMPFMLSAAITAGVAPLLFLQVLYRTEFYTANLLLFYRWMAILPALVAGFYLSYLLKTKLVRSWRLAGRIAVGCGALACFAFVGWSWVENHLLSLQPQRVWQQQYASGAMIFHTPELVPRLVLWFVAAFPTMALMVGWQLWVRGREAVKLSANSPAPLAGTRRTSSIALVGILVSSIAAGSYFFLLNDDAQRAITGMPGLPYLVMAVAGGLIQAIAWLPQFQRGRLSFGWLALASLGLAVNFVGMVVVNEATRLATLEATIGLDLLFERHRQAAKVGGLPLFVFFFVVNGSLIALCIYIVRRYLRPKP